MNLLPTILNSVGLWFTKPSRIELSVVTEVTRPSRRAWTQSEYWSNSVRSAWGARRFTLAAGVELRTEQVFLPLRSATPLMVVSFVLTMMSWPAT